MSAADELGTDWTFAAVYVSVMREPLDAGQHQTAILVGGRASLAYAALLALWRSPT